ncbi:MAG: sensor histidine kinase [Lachnospiraceae bacterium]
MQICPVAEMWYLLANRFEVFENQDLRRPRADFKAGWSVRWSGSSWTLVNISRMETGMIAVKRVEQKLFDTILEAVNRVWVKADQKHIAVHLTANGLEDVRILHDRKWMCEAIVNILENAVKYSPSHTVVTIGLEKRAHFIRIQISDEGIGIEKSEYHKIFQRFYRGSRPEVQSQDGAGVGLYLSRKIVEDHQGMIMADSTNQGTTFVIALPFAQ